MVSKLGPVSAERKAIAVRYGLQGVEDAAVSARAADLPFWAACALLEQESGGRNVWGHDKGGALSGCPLPVTQDGFAVFSWLVLEQGQTSNGVGPCQITYAGRKLASGGRDGGFFREMGERGLRPWVPRENMLFGFELLAEYRRNHGSWTLAGVTYNGGSEYGRQLVARMNIWRERFGIKGTVQ